MFIIKFLLKRLIKIFLIPVWILLALAGMLVSLIVTIYGIGRAVCAFLLTILMIAVIICYHDWIQAAFLFGLYAVLFGLLFAGVTIETLLEGAREKVMEIILS